MFEIIKKWIIKKLSGKKIFKEKKGASEIEYDNIKLSPTGNILERNSLKVCGQSLFQVKNIYDKLRKEKKK